MNRSTAPHHTQQRTTAPPHSAIKDIANVHVSMKRQDADTTVHVTGACVRACACEQAGDSGGDT